MPRMIPTHEPQELIPISEAPLTSAKRFRSNVLRKMKEQNLSNAALAERIETLGVKASEDSVRMLLKSDSFPSVKWLEVMARALDCDESEFLAA